MEAHCVALELKYQNQALKLGQHGRALKDINDIETINIELEYSVAKLFQENENLHNENEHFKQTYKDLYDSITLTRTQRKNNSDSLIVHKCVFNSNHDAYVSKFINDVNARTKKPKVVPISTRKPTKNANQSITTPHKKTFASETTIQKSKSYFRLLYEKTSKAWTWWIEKQCPLGYILKSKVKNDNALTSDSLPSDIKSRSTTNSEPLNKMGSNLSNSSSSSKCFANLTNHPNHYRLWIHKARDGKPQVAVDLVQGNVMIKRVYYLEGLNHNLFYVGQFCNADLEVAFRKSTCFVRDLQGNDLLTTSPTQAWLWHCRLSHLNFDTITLLSKNDIVNGLPKLKYVKDQLCSSCEIVESINGKKYILVIVDDYSRYTLTHFLRSKDETPEVLINFRKMIQRGLQAQMINVRTDRCLEFLNKTLQTYFKKE
ncbi:retrovirus-related pol polyprotein from transposon TNT 1-94 [Tanacetum coccineum]